jgi:hypothetical protein
MPRGRILSVSHDGTTVKVAAEIPETDDPTAYYEATLPLADLVGKTAIERRAMIRAALVAERNRRRTPLVQMDEFAGVDVDV